MFCLLFHGGCQSSRRLTGSVPISSSINTSKGSKVDTPRSQEKDIKRIVEDFTKAANRCVVQGLMVLNYMELMDILFHNFLKKKTNKRRDMWGRFKRKISFPIRNI